MLTRFPSNVDVLVIGAGPTGLGAAKRLQQLVSRINKIMKIERISLATANDAWESRTVPHG